MILMTFVDEVTCFFFGALKTKRWNTVHSCSSDNVLLLLSSSVPDRPFGDDRD